MKIIFLDFDGVLNCLDYLSQVKAKYETLELPKIERDAAQLDPSSVAKLNKIIKYTGAHIVVSATLRTSYAVEELQQLLVTRGFVGKVIGKTPFLVEQVGDKHIHKIRGEEIQAWLNEHEPTLGIEHIIILDDESDMGNLEFRLIKSNYFQGGLQEHHVQESISMLTNN